MNDSVVIGELTWPEYARRVASGSPIFLPVGALEQHGHHMCMEVDVLLPTALCKAVARNVDGLVLPIGLRLQVAAKIGRRKPLSRHHQPGWRNTDTYHPGHHQGAGPARRASAGDDERALRETPCSSWKASTWRCANSVMPASPISRSWSCPTGTSSTRLRSSRNSTLTDSSVGTLNTVASSRLRWMLALHPEKVDLTRAVDHPPATFPPYDVFPIIAERTPACGTLSSPKGASREKGELILRVCTEGISNAVREAFS
uniref:Creatininase n=1 Tax=Pseudomonas putida TaxID=303 RepID=Q9R3Y2_PSEPU|nr:creatininase [Pseudomonas putida]AAD55802.2 creatininase [Pseudomonas putida]